MAIYHLYNGGEAIGNNRRPMYPRPEPLYTDKGPNAVAYEKHHSGIALSRIFNSDDCIFGNEKCVEWGVGDVFSLLLLPTEHLYKGLWIKILNGIDGIEFNVLRQTVEPTGLVAQTNIADGLSATPYPAPVIDPATLGKCDRPALEDFCRSCGGEGGSQYIAPAAPYLVGEPADLQTEPYRELISIEITAVPDDFDCSKCALEIMLSADLTDLCNGN